MVIATLKNYSTKTGGVLLDIGGEESWYPAMDVIKYIKPEMKGTKVNVTFDEKDGKKVVFIKSTAELPQNIGGELKHAESDRESYWMDKFSHDKANSIRISKQACLNTSVEIIKMCKRDDKEYTPEGMTEAVILIANKLREWVGD